MNIVHGNIGPVLPSVGTALRAIAAALGAFNRARLERAQLAALDERALHDLALSRADQIGRIEAPLWPAVRDAFVAAWRRP